MLLKYIKASSLKKASNNIPNFIIEIKTPYTRMESQFSFLLTYLSNVLCASISRAYSGKYYALVNSDQYTKLLNFLKDPKSLDGQTIDSMKQQDLFKISKVSKHVSYISVPYDKAISYSGTFSKMAEKNKSKIELYAPQYNGVTFGDEKYSNGNMILGFSSDKKDLFIELVSKIFPHLNISATEVKSI